MKQALLRGLFFATLLPMLSANAAFAQAQQRGCQRVIQNGAVINGQPVVWIANCLIGAAGGSNGSTIVNGLPMITDFGVMGRLGILDAPITGAYHQALEYWSGNNFIIGLNSFGGAGTPAAYLQINNGPLQPLPGSGGGIIPNSPLISGNGVVLGSMAVGNGLGVTGSFPTQTLVADIPNSVIVTGNGTTYGNMAVGAGLSISGSFPTQTLTATSGGSGTVGSGTGPALAQYVAGTTTTVGPESVSANLSNPQGGPLDISNTTVTPGSYTNTNLTVDPKGRITAASSGTGVSGFTGGITVASACTGASCTPVTSCLTYSTGLLSSIVSGSCSGTNYLLIQSGSAMLIQTGSHLLIQ